MARDALPVTEREVRASLLDRAGRAAETGCAKALRWDGQRSEESCMAGEGRERREEMGREWPKGHGRTLAFAFQRRTRPGFGSLGLLFIRSGLEAGSGGAHL